MKKITLLVALFIAATTFAQVVDRPADGGNSIISVDGNDGNVVFCADTFTIASDIILGELDVLGTNSSGGALDALLTGFSVYIYADFGGIEPDGDPAGGGNAAVVSMPNIPISAVDVIEDAAGVGNFTIRFTDANGGTQITLPAGVYWLAVGANTDDSLGSGRWNWQLSSFVADVQPVLIDPADLFGVGATVWTNIGALIGADAFSMAWQLRDEALGNEDNTIEGAFVYPNPINEVLNVSLPSSAEVLSSNLYNILGQDTGLKLVNGTMNTNGLAEGVYILNVETSAGTLTQKVVKQ
ncbi:MAG: hypothetical protein COB12_13145 [Flavobacterium sp.]|nr:MAG: hypothetical protein COB12_13145 [Flavobacterium sp.]